MPNISQPLSSPQRTTARIAAFMPGASPPLVRSATFLRAATALVYTFLRAIPKATGRSLREREAECCEVGRRVHVGEALLCVGDAERVHGDDVRREAREQIAEGRLALAQ